MVPSLEQRLSHKGICARTGHTISEELRVQLPQCKGRPASILSTYCNQPRLPCYADQRNARSTMSFRPIAALCLFRADLSDHFHRPRLPNHRGWLTDFHLFLTV